MSRMRTHSWRARADARSADAGGRRDGFTLVELLVSMAVMGIISTVNASVIGIAVRNNPAVELRTDAALTLKGVTTWLPQDVDSTPPTGFDTNPSTVSGCAQSPGVNLLRMHWTEQTTGATQEFIANYRYVNTGSQNIIERITCNGTSSFLGNTSMLKATGPLAPMPVGWTQGQLPVAVTVATDVSSGDVTLVTMSVLTANNKLLTVEAAPKNPANTLPPNTVGVGLISVTTVLATTTTIAATTTTVPSATTIAETTTIAVTTTTVAPCNVLSASLSPISVKNTAPNGNGNSSTNVGVLAKGVTITVQTSGNCAGLEARALSGAPNGELFRNFSTTNGSTYTALMPGYPQGSSELWADGFRPINFYSPTGGPYGSVTLEVT